MSRPPNSTLADYDTGELLGELERRFSIKDFSPLIDKCKEFFDGYHDRVHIEDTIMQFDIYQIAMEAVFGKDIWASGWFHRKI